MLKRKGRPKKRVSDEDEEWESLAQMEEEQWEEWPDEVEREANISNKSYYSDKSWTKTPPKVETPTMQPTLSPRAKSPRSKSPRSKSPGSAPAQSPAHQRMEGLEELQKLMNKENTEKLPPFKRIKLEKLSPETSDEPINKDYFYFCLDCEAGEDPEDLARTRFPLTMDLAGHITSTDHQHFTPIKKSLDVRLGSVSYRAELNKTVIKKWKRLVKDGDIQDIRYSAPRKCGKCAEVFDDAVDMFKHIKEVHVDPLIGTSTTSDVV